MTVTIPILRRVAERPTTCWYYYRQRVSTVTKLPEMMQCLQMMSRLYDDCRKLKMRGDTVSWARIPSRSIGLENQQLLYKIIDALPFAVVVVNPLGLVEFWNKSTERIFGWKSSEVLGCHNPIVPRDRLDEFRAFSEIVCQGKLLRVKSLRQRKDGALVKVESTLIPLRSASGSVEHILILHEPGSDLLRLSKSTRQPLTESERSLSEHRGHNGHQGQKDLSDFTPRQREIIMLVARGHDNSTIAKQLGLGNQVVKNYLRGIYREVNIHNRTELLVWAKERIL